MDNNFISAWDHTLFQYDTFAIHVSKMTNEKFREEGLIHIYDVLS
jgi:hypothetical protein